MAVAGGGRRARAARPRADIKEMAGEGARAEAADGIGRLFLA